MTTPPLTPEQKLKHRQDIATILIESGMEEHMSGLLGEDAPYSHGLASVVTEGWLAKFITDDPAMIELKNEVRLLSNVNDPVLIQGASGTGKELIAHALHGKRRGNFRALNCAGLPFELIESELFGHVRGSFTGAVRDTLGVFREAENGTVFLDEIGDLPLHAQSKLLRVLQSRKVRPVGSSIEVDVNARVIAATHKNLKLMTTEPSTFRHDLYFRLTRFELSITPLRDRLTDIDLILKSLFKGEIPADFLRPWPLELEGNVRELENAVRRYQVLIKKQVDVI